MEMLIGKLMDYAIAQWPQVLLVLNALGTLCIVGSAYILASPSEKDDSWLQKIEAHKYFGFALRFLKRFSLLERKKSEK